MIDRNLDGKLRAIQELKRENYIGTKIAKKYLDRVDGLYENPKIVSNAINERLAEQGEVDYPATPERIVGLGYYFPKILGRAELDLEAYDESDLTVAELGDSPIYTSLRELTNANDILTEAGYQSKSNDGTLSGLTNYLTSLFLENQSQGTTNKDFAVHAIQYPAEIEKIPDDIKKSMLKSAALFRWDRLLSKDNLRDLESKIKRRIFNEEIVIEDKIDLIMNDQADHKLEYRREILTDLLERAGNPDYDTLRRQCIKFLGNARRHVKYYQDVGGHDVMKDHVRRRANQLEFTLSIVTPEENFINRYLNS